MADPATVAIAFILATIKEYGALGVGAIVAYYAGRAAVSIIQAWLRGDFFPRAQHEAITRQYDQRIIDYAGRLKEMAEEAAMWRRVALRGAAVAEGATKAIASGSALGRLDAPDAGSPGPTDAPETPGAPGG